MNKNNIEVSVICNTYNQESYIRDALESFVRQKTKFKFEILVHDDASTDRTASIIREYEKKYPELINAIYQESNQYSIDSNRVSDIQNARAKGKYIALCEGDDYWIDEYKLQKQYEAMEDNPEIDICATAATVEDAGTKKVLSEKAPFMQSCIIPVEDVIKGGGGYVATNSLMYRAQLNDNMPLFRKNWRYDYTLQILGSLRGGMLYLNDNTAVYRWMAKGSWSSKTYASREKYIENILSLIEMLKTLNRETNGKHLDAIDDTLKKNEFVILRLTGNLKEMKSGRYRQLFDGLEMKDKIKAYVKYFFPFLMGDKLR